MTTRGRGSQLASGAVAIALVGLFGFGVWHVVVGGAIHGNGRAALFGVALAGASAAALVAVARLTGVRRFGR